MMGNSTRIILASSSVYRQELLRRLQIDFETVVPDIDESVKAGEKPSALVQRLAQEKAAVIANNVSNAIVIGSDQVAAFDDTILGKPGNFETAVEQLKMISGKTVIFHTGLAVIDTNTSTTQIDDIQTRVEFKTLSEETIKSYLEKEPAFNCAGSFKSESLGIALTKKISEDDPTALIGLPLIRLVQMLEKIGYPVI